MVGRLVHLLSLTTLLLTGASCVVPVGPEWSDPKGNAAPTISFANPPVGSVLDFSATGNAPLGLEIGLSDPNTRDNLEARWIIDYPPFVEGVSHLAPPLTLPGGDQVERTHIRYAPNCGDDVITHQFSLHRLLLAVSDRPFGSEDPSRLDGVPGGNYLVEGAWTFDLTCP